MANVKLKNLLKRARAFNLEHSTFLNQAGEHGVGKPESLSFLPLELKEVHPDVLECREIKSALKPKKGRPTLRVLS